MTTLIHELLNILLILPRMLYYAVKQGNKQEDEQAALYTTIKEIHDNAINTNT